jgi:hypothetical protein
MMFYARECVRQKRLAFFLSRGFNELLVSLGRKPLFSYLVSGMCPSCSPLSLSHRTHTNTALLQEATKR